MSSVTWEMVTAVFLSYGIPDKFQQSEFRIDPSGNSLTEFCCVADVAESLSVRVIKYLFV